MSTIDTFDSLLTELQHTTDQLFTSVNCTTTQSNSSSEHSTNCDVSQFHPLYNSQWPQLVYDSIEHTKLINKYIQQYTQCDTTSELYRILQYYSSESVNKHKAYNNVQNSLHSTIETLEQHIQQQNTTSKYIVQLQQSIKQLRTELKLAHSGNDTAAHIGVASNGKLSAFVCDIYFGNNDVSDVKFEIIRNDNTIQSTTYNTELLYLIRTQQYDALKHIFQCLLYMEHWADTSNDITVYQQYTDVQVQFIKYNSVHTHIQYTDTAVGSQLSIMPELSYNNVVLSPVYKLTYIGAQKLDIQSKASRYIYMFELNVPIVLPYNIVREIYKQCGLTYGFVDIFGKPSDGSDTYALQHNGSYHAAMLKHNNSNVQSISSTVYVYDNVFNVATADNDNTKQIRGLLTKVIYLSNMKQLNQLESLINTLRQYIIFHMLYCSCYCINTIYHTDIYNNTQQPINVVVSTQLSASKIMLALQLPNTTHTSTITIQYSTTTQSNDNTLLSHANIATTIQFEKQHKFKCTEEYANKILRHSASIAVMLHYILRA